MGEYGREQRNQLSRAVGNSEHKSGQLKGFADNRSQTIKYQNTQCEVDKISNNGHVTQQSKKGIVLGGLIGAGLGSIGFLANPLLGGVLSSIGALTGMVAGHFLTRNKTEISPENDVEIPQEITLSEDEVGEASQSITYPSVTSCMTVTLILVDGNKIGGHFALYGKSAGEMIGDMNEKRRERQVNAIVVKGHLSLWGKELENALELTPKVQSEHPELITDNEEEWATTLLSYSVIQNQEYFRGWIASHFGGTGVVNHLQNVEDGDVIS